MNRRFRWLLLFIGLLGCRQQGTIPTAAPEPIVIETATVVPTPFLSLTDMPESATPPPSTVAPTLPIPTPTPFVLTNPAPPCGTLLPLRLIEESSTVVLTSSQPLTETVPVAALPAVEELWQHPQRVGLAAFRLGDTENGVYLNADVPMPLASVVKVIHLITYALAVEDGTLQPQSKVAIADLERFYLPRSDLNSHQQALAELAEAGRLVDNGTSVWLYDVPWMMMRHSSNVATDYLHWLLGQTRIEESIRALGLRGHSAPCPFLGRFLAMHNHERSGSDRAALDQFVETPALYGERVSFWTDWFAQNDLWRAAEIRSWSRPNPTVSTQKAYTAAFDTRGTAREYATLMARILDGSLGSPRVNAIIRNAFEWPIEEFDSNRQLFTTVGYKGGSLPGVLTTLYYAWPRGSNTPVIVALFYHDLETRTYQRWRRSLPHDELARWLLYDPEAIATLGALLNTP